MPNGEIGNNCMSSKSYGFMVICHLFSDSPWTMEFIEEDQYKEFKTRTKGKEVTVNMESEESQPFGFQLIKDLWEMTDDQKKETRTMTSLTKKEFDDFLKDLKGGKADE